MGVIYHMVYLTTIIDTWGLTGMMHHKIGISMLRLLYVQMGINTVFAIYMVFLQSLSERKKNANRKKYKNLYRELMSHEKYFCLKSHPMEFKTMNPDDFYNGEAKCHDCFSQIKEEDPYVICDKCEIYVCLNCSHEYIRKLSKKYRCFEGHRMTL